MYDSIHRIVEKIGEIEYNKKQILTKSLNMRRNVVHGFF